MDVSSILRKLAKSNKWQTIFSYSKEMNNIRLFENEMEFTQLQLSFLRYLNFYNSIFTDISLGEVEESVLEDEIYEDAYVLYRSKNIGKLKKQNQQQPNLDNKEMPFKTTQWRIKNRTKRDN